MIKENKWQRTIAGETRPVGAQVLAKIGTLYEGPGWPDLYVAHRIWTGWIELKVGVRKLDSKQVDRIRLLRGTGVNVAVLRLTENVEILENEHGDKLAAWAHGGNPGRQDPVRGLARLRKLAEHAGVNPYEPGT